MAVSLLCRSESHEIFNYFLQRGEVEDEQQQAQYQSLMDTRCEWLGS